MSQTYPTHEEIQQLYEKLFEMRLDKWLNHELFTFQWFLLLAVLIFPWFIWWRFVDKNRIVQILLFGALLSILVVF
ncbi:hypothetical protein [Salipaludibacillus daqingensis]|uniref:hypothetical protein n=1 Tax=Salipaludibacillus daqingensis TaxID=3041001 RepID=UPI002473AD23|nr:hypothetical protein [Salipaludibacillus daqingensis]